MSKERLSKLQKDILLYMKKQEEKYSWYKSGHHLDIIKYELKPIPQSFSRSIRNLLKKGLIEVTYRGNYEWIWKEKNKCDGRNPEEGNPCDNCLWFKKWKKIYPMINEYNDFSVGDNKCHIGFRRELYIIQSWNLKNKQIREIKLSDKGKRYLVNVNCNN